MWLHLTLAASPILTEELGALLGGVAVSQGQVQLGTAILALTLGGWVATALLYALGRWRGRWVRRRFPAVGTTMKRWLRAVRRRPWGSALAVRFAFGARLLLPLACGAAHVHPFRYLVGSAISSIAWTVVFTEVGFVFGEAAIVALRRMEDYDQYVVAVAVGLAVVAWLIWRDRKRRVAPHVEVRDGGV